MYFARYLLSIEEFLNTEQGEALLERVFFCVDETRRGKAERMKTGRAAAACLGAGLLLQLAVGEALEKTGNKGEREEKAVSVAAAEMSEIKVYSVSQLLAYVEETPHVSLSYTYGENGKPYFKDLPFYFNLSHSGDYVLCGFSDVEIGADIQKHCGKNVEKLARRFFSEREADALEQAGEEREKLFYRLWARKEAYGKLTGRGVADVLGMDMLSADRQLIWGECDSIEGYSIAFCVENAD